MTGLPAVTNKAFERVDGSWRIRPNCLNEYYSSGERVVCSILVHFYLEDFTNAAETLIMPDPERREGIRYLSEYIWPGAQWFYQAQCDLTKPGAWSAIRGLLG